MKPRIESIVGRLTVLYTLSAFAMLLLAAIFLHWTLAANLRREDGEFLADKVRLLRTILKQEHAGVDELREEVEWETAALHFAKYYARVCDAHGRTIIETPQMAAVLSASTFPRAQPGPALEPHVVARTLNDGDRFVLLSARAAGDLTVQVALDVSPEEKFLQNYRRSLALAVLFGVAFSALAGGFVARRGMRPLAELTRLTDDISASRLDQRVSGESWPAELSALAKGFDRMLDRLEDSFKRLSQFSGDLAHELRTPINNLRGEAGVALSQSRTADEYRRTLESSLEEFARLAALIDNLLFLARAERPTASITRTECDLGRAAAAMCEFYEPLAQDRGVELRCGASGPVHADLSLLRQALGNLLSNALNHTPRGGFVGVSSVPTADGGVALSVRDTGTGIPAEHLGRIFDRLYRVDPSRAQNAGGAGIGLAIVKSIMALHCGEVTVESEVGRGSTFTLAFPPADGHLPKVGAEKKVDFLVSRG